MERPVFGGREPFWNTAAIGWHLVEAHRPIPIGGKREALAVWRPDGALIVAAECELLDLCVASKVVDPEDVAVIFHCLHDQLPSVG